MSTTTVVNKNRERYDVYIGRGSPLGNPYAIGLDGSREAVILKHRIEFAQRLIREPAFVREIESLRGKRLGCFCKPAACHGDNYADFLNHGLRAFTDILEYIPEPERERISALASCVALPGPSLDPSVAPVMAYAGIGARKTPADIQTLMTEIATDMGDLGYRLRSGGAAGADTAFAEGAGEDVDIYLPWRGFSGHQFEPAHHTGWHYQAGVGEQALRLASRFHPAWDRCGSQARLFHGRNSYQVLGPRLNQPAAFVVCWTPGGRGEGGTGQALRIARFYGIPAHDLGCPETLKHWVDSGYRKTLIAESSLAAMRDTIGPIDPVEPDNPGEPDQRPQC